MMRDCEHFSPCFFCCLVVTVLNQFKKIHIGIGECKMGKALIIGAGGVASVAVHKCVQNSEVFEEICIASRTKSKCDELKAKLEGGKTKMTTAQVDADNVD